MLGSLYRASLFSETEDPLESPLPTLAQKGGATSPDGQRTKQLQLPEIQPCVGYGEQNL